MLRILSIGAIVVSVFMILVTFLWSKHVQHEIQENEVELQEYLKKGSEFEEKERQEHADENLKLPQPQTWEEEWTEILDEVQNQYTHSNDETLLGISVGTPEPPEKLRVSPFGFGPYPEIPEDYPYDVAWDSPSMANIPQERQRTFELLSRVRVKLWKQGNRDVIGLKLDSTQKVYLIYPRTVYLRYKIHEKIGDGSDSFLFGSGISVDTFGGSDISPSEHTRIAEGEKPPGIRILDYDSAGFDPYEFLGLNK